MTATSLTVLIANSSYTIEDGSLSIQDKIEERSTCTFTVYDANSTYSFSKGQLVTVSDTLEGLLFSGFIQTIKRTVADVGTYMYHNITCTDRVAIIDSQLSNTAYTNRYAGAIAVDQIKTQWTNGILANFAIDNDTTQADFQAGNLSGTIATNNVDDGDLELAPAGATTTIVENTTSAFGAGTLTNMSASNNALGPSATSALKIQATQSVVGVANSYTYVKIWSGSIAIISGRYLAYDIWISSSSPQAMIGVDMVFTDGNAYRDLATSNFGQWFDSQNKSPHPNTDLKGLAVDQWYHRKFLLDNFTSKTIAYVTVAIEGDNGGTYTGYIKNIYEVDVSNNIVNTFFAGSLNINPPQQMQKQGYGTTSVTIVNTYDCSTASRVSPTYSTNHTNILKSSFLNYKTTLPTGYTFNLGYSIDGGNSYTSCTNNAALPNLLAGQSVSGKSIQFKQSFVQGTGSDPSQQPLLTSMQAWLYPSYTATKTDINTEWTTNAQWNISGTTFTSTTAPAAILAALGAVRNWDDANIANQTLFGGGATGPNNANSCFQYVDSKQYRMVVHQSTEARSRLDFAGSWQNFQMEFDVYIDNSAMKPGCVYRTTGWSNFDANYAYAVEIFGTSIALQRGSNSSAGSTGTRTQVAIATVNLTQQAVHRIKLIINGSSHQIYFDDTLAINATDSTYTATGNVGFRVSNTDASNGYISLFDNFGISPTSLGGSWTSQSVSLTSAGTYGGSTVQWVDVSTDPTQVTNTVQSSTNGGSSWQTLTNGGSIPSLALGQSLSGVSVQYKIIFSTNSSTVLPQMQSLTSYVLGGFSSSGTRINKALLLSGVGICGSTLVSWNAITPTNTSVAFATSLDGTSYTSVANGGSVSGLNQQPAPTLDTFDVISSGNYTNTFRSGGAVASWVWDTTNSRLTVSGGTNAQLIYSAISASNVDIVFDLDQADNCGVVWRWTNNTNYYELLVYDASSSAGSTNVLKLFKTVSNTRSQIGSNINITLARGVIVKRARVTMIGTAITVYFDGTNVLSTTDSSLAGPGNVGFSSLSGIGRIYNLRIQPQGDNLSGKLVYVKETLTSTDPTATPQITDMTTLVTNPNISAGALIANANYVNTYKSDNVKDLSKQSNYYWNIKQDGSFIFIPRQTVPSPWVVTALDILSQGLDAEYVADVYRNRQTITGVLSTIVTSETHTGDGSTTSWTLKYNVVSMSSVVLNGQTKTFGIKGVDTGKDFYYQVGTNSFVQDTSGVVLNAVVDQFTVSYTGQTTTSVTRDNTGQFAGTTSQKQYLDMSGVSIPVQIILNQASATITANGNSDDLDVSLLHRLAVDINITAQAGTSPTVQFFVDRKAADGSYDPIWQSSVNSTAPAVISTTIGPKCAVTELLGLTVRIRWVIGGSASPSKTFSISLQARVDPSLGGIGIVEAVEDVTGQNINVAGAQVLGDGRLQQNGLVGRTAHFQTKRTGLAPGQYAPVFLPSIGLNDASMLITSITRNQSFKMDTGSPSESYVFTVEATDGASLGSWSNSFNQTL